MMMRPFLLFLIKGLIWCQVTPPDSVQQIKEACVSQEILGLGYYNNLLVLRTSRAYLWGQLDKSREEVSLVLDQTMLETSTGGSLVTAFMTPDRSMGEILGTGTTATTASFSIAHRDIRSNGTGIKELTGTSPPIPMEDYLQSGKVTKVLGSGSAGQGSTLVYYREGHRYFVWNGTSREIFPEDPEMIPRAFVPREEQLSGPEDTMIFGSFGVFFARLTPRHLMTGQKLEAQVFEFSSHLMGCPQNFCFETAFDSATSQTLGSTKVYRIFREGYTWLSTTWPPTESSLRTASGEPRVNTISQEFSLPKGIRITAAFSHEPTLFLIHDDQVTHVSSGKTGTVPLKSVFPGVEVRNAHQRVRAALSVDQKIFLFADCCSFNVYRGNSFPFDMIESNVNLTRLPGVPADIDAILYDTSSSLVYVHKENFYWTLSRGVLEGSATSDEAGAHSSLESMACPEAQSLPSLAKYLGVKSRTEYIELMGRIRPAAKGYLVRGPGADGGEPSKAPAKGFSKNIKMIVIASSVALALIIVIVLIVLMCRCRVSREYLTSLAASLLILELN